MRVAYVSVDLGDPDAHLPLTFTVSPVPLLYHEGELLTSFKTVLKSTDSYSALCSILKQDFQIPESMLPTEKYFKPNKAEKEKEERNIVRTVPEGAGEPEWRLKARQALLDAVDEASSSLLVDGKATVNGNDCFSLEELRKELEAVAEKAGGKKKIKDKPYQPDYEALVQEALTRVPDLLHYSGLPKTRKHPR